MDDFKDTTYHVGWLILLTMVAIPGGWDWFDTLVVGTAALLTIPMFLWDWRARQERLVVKAYFDEAESYQWTDCAEGCCH